MRSPITTSERFGGASAVVLGGSMAGLLVARVLADHFDQVSIVERDALPDNAEPRKGVPQGRHLHGLLKPTLIDVPWQMTTLEDFRYPEVIGERPRGYALRDVLMRRIHRVSARDPEVLLHFLRAMHMLESPAELFRPRMLLRILKG
jgi:hypothetical protein